MIVQLGLNSLHNLKKSSNGFKETHVVNWNLFENSTFMLLLLGVFHMLVLGKNIKHVVTIHSGKGSTLITFAVARGGKGLYYFLYLDT